MLDEHISLRDYERTVESKIAKNIGLLQRARQVLTEASLETAFPILAHIWIMQILHAPVPMLQN